MFFRSRCPFLISSISIIRSRGESKEAQAAYWATHSQKLQKGDENEDLTLGRLDELAKKESQRGGAAEGAGRYA